MVLANQFIYIQKWLFSEWRKFCSNSQEYVCICRETRSVVLTVGMFGQASSDDFQGTDQEHQI